MDICVETWYFERLYLLDDLVFDLFHLELVLLLAILCVC